MIRFKIIQPPATEFVVESGRVALQLREQEQVRMTVERAVRIYEAEMYAGPYSVTPSPDAQTLETEGLVMQEDVNIRSIPFFEVSNTVGGTTVYIGKEI